jgi:diguanylate cyclase (GGDEF)-like protein
VFERFDRIAGALRRWQVLAAALTLLALVGIVDRASGYELSLSVLYLVPIAFASWYAGRGVGWAIALVSGLVWLGADLGAGHRYSHSYVMVWNTLVRVSIFVIVADLLARLKAQLVAARQLARSDGLTGIANRRAFDEQLQHALALSARMGQPLTLAYIDVDDLKRLNDRDGHDAGDRALTVVARTLGEAMRRTDTAARLGGDEFALLLPNTGRAGAESVIGKARGALAQGLRAEGLTATCSIGAVTFVTPPPRAADALRAADDLMYEVKSRGKNAVAYAQQD